MVPYLLEKTGTGTSFGREYPRLGKSAVDGTKVAEEAEGGAGVLGGGGMYVCDGTAEPGWK